MCLVTAAGPEGTRKEEASTSDASGKYIKTVESLEYICTKFILYSCLKRDYWCATLNI